MSRGIFSLGDFVLGGYCPGGFSPGGFVRGDFVLIPLKIASRICQFSQYSGTKLDMLFEIAKSVEIVKISGKQLFYPTILDFMEKHYSVATFVCINLPKKPIVSIN